MITTDVILLAWFGVWFGERLWSWIAAGLFDRSS